MNGMRSDDETGDPLVRLTSDQIMAICQRTFGPTIQLESVDELGGGTVNHAYLVTVVPTRKVLLRIAPPSTTPISWDTTALMRREHSIRPFFAAIADLMPQPLLTDFTHQLLDRDYMVQTFIEGERRDAVADQLTHEEQAALWTQFGKILKTIHATRGEVFGFPYPGTHFDTWSQTVMTWVERIRADVHAARLSGSDLEAIANLIHSNIGVFKAISEPRLLHGDLWLFNLLIQRTPGQPRIVGVLDPDRAWWGDPMADWTMFVLDHADATEIATSRTIFWQAYGRPAPTREADFRSQVYAAMHAGMALVWAVTQQDQDTIERAQNTLQSVATNLPAVLP